MDIFNRPKLEWQKEPHCTLAFSKENLMGLTHKLTQNIHPATIKCPQVKAKNPQLHKKRIKGIIKG